MTTTPEAGPVTAAPAPGGPWRDPRPRRTRLAGPLTALGIVGAATAYVALVDPGQPGHYPGCPFLALTGFDCPACGGLRAVHALAHGDVVAAMDHNLLAVLAVPVVAVLWVLWVVRAWRGVSVSADPVVLARRNRTVIGVGVLLLVFWLVRNLPFAEYLRSTLSG